MKTNRDYQTAWKNTRHPCQFAIPTAATRDREEEESEQTHHRRNDNYREKNPLVKQITYTYRPARRRRATGSRQIQVPRSPTGPMDPSPAQAAASERDRSPPPPPPPPPSSSASPLAVVCNFWKGPPSISLALYCLDDDAGSNWSAPKGW